MLLDPLELVAVVACVGIVVLGVRRRQAPADIDDIRRSLEELRQRERAALGERDARLERLEHAVDVIAVEVERIGEGQRFLTKVLSERTPDQRVADPSAARERIVTPH